MGARDVRGWSVLSRRVVTEENSSTLYPSPTWPTVLICQHLLSVLPRGAWLEPSCGDGTLMLAVEKVLSPASWTGIEIVDESAALARRRVPRADVITGDAREELAETHRVGNRFDVSIGNNPFPEAIEIVRACLNVALWVINLQRLDWLEGKERRKFFVEFPPDVYVLPNRPKFKYRQDSGGYAWYVWPPPSRFDEEARDYPAGHPTRRRSYGRLYHLPTVPKSLRAEHRLQTSLEVG